MENLPFLSKSSWQDIQLIIRFLTIRVRNPDNHNCKKIQRVLSHLNATINNIKLHLNANNLNVIHLWADASYGAHLDLKGKTGATIFIGEDCVTSSSKKHKVNTTRSTISEVGGVHEASPQMLWTNAFLQNQGDEVYKAPFYQENMSTMLLKKNRHASSSSRTKNIEIKYFLILDRIEKGDTGLEYCHTKKMMADFVTKPLQGGKFFKFKYCIMRMSSSENIAKGQKVIDEIA